nr:hypothetical protein [Tengunoibacter tsumagoiensis]
MSDNIEIVYSGDAGSRDAGPASGGDGGTGEIGVERCIDIWGAGTAGLDGTQQWTIEFVHMDIESATEVRASCIISIDSANTLTEINTAIFSPTTLIQIAKTHHISPIVCGSQYPGIAAIVVKVGGLDGIAIGILGSMRLTLIAVAGKVALSRKSFGEGGVIGTD